MRTVLVILAAEQRRRIIQSGRIKRAEIFRQAVKFLINIRLQQVKHVAGRKLMRLFPVIHKPVNAILHAPAGDFGRGGFKAKRLTQAIAAQFSKGVAEDQIIQRKLAERLLAHHWVRDKGRSKNIALQNYRRALMYFSTQDFFQSVTGDSSALIFYQNRNQKKLLTWHTRPFNHLIKPGKDAGEIAFIDNEFSFYLHTIRM